MSKAKVSLVQLIVAVCGVFAVLFGVTMFNRVLLMQIPLPPRLILMIVTQWLLFLVPGLLMAAGKEHIVDLGFKKGNIPLQIGLGVLLAAAMSLLLTVLPILLGFRNMVSSTSYNQAWKFIYEFIYATAGVALAEELIFRGYLFHKLLAVKNSKWFAIVVSSVLFGLFHVFGGSIVQMLMMAVLGVIFCLFREKIKGCTLLSLIIAHGLYDAMIVLWVSVL